MPLILTCPNCGLPITVRFFPVNENHDSSSEKVDCGRCHSVYQVSVNLLHLGDPYNWNPNTGELTKVTDTRDSVDKQRCPHGRDRPANCPICKDKTNVVA